MPGKKFLKMLIVLCLVLFVLGCAQKAQELPEEPGEPFVETGVLDIKSSPAGAQVYVDGELKGDAPVTLFNFPVGRHSVIVKNEGYIDFEKEVTIVVGRTQEVDALLSPVTNVKEPDAPAGKTEEDVPEPQASEPINRIELSNFATYIDFDKMVYTGIRADNSDLFVRRYDSYLDIVTLAPAKLDAVDIPLSEIKKEDCLNAGNGLAQLSSKQTLCVISMEGAYFAASWDKTPAELDWIALE